MDIDKQLEKANKDVKVYNRKFYPEKIDLAELRAFSRDFANKMITDNIYGRGSNAIKKLAEVNTETKDRKE